MLASIAPIISPAMIDDHTLASRRRASMSKAGSANITMANSEDATPTSNNSTA
jgi:hypothetical protein